MKRLAFLKTIVTISFILCMVAVIFGLPFILLVVFFPDTVPFKFNGQLDGAGRAQVIFLVSMFYLGHCVFTYGIYKLKATLELFYKKVFFDDRVIAALNLSGKAFIIAAVVWVVPPFFYKVIANGDFEMGIDFSGFGSTFFSLSIGLFFIVLSEVFANAKQLKEENDLTV
ncbi:DUF2975 domain-containing protein [Flavobacterium sp. RHBU_24]|uniref:DUF2975 domain-containing protein n=1 Tax=Flavobacterium sp. RHBU_24 TaxID=3391185 RepID=UPI0039853529